MFVPKLDDLVEYRDYLQKAHDTASQHLDYCLERRRSIPFFDYSLNDHIHELRKNISQLERALNAIDTLVSLKDVHLSF